MKKILFLIAGALMLGSMVEAQSLGSDFNKAGASGCFVTDLDTMSWDTPDTVQTPLNPFRNSVGFEMESVKISGTHVDSTVLEVWGTKVAGGTTGWVLLVTKNMVEQEDPVTTQYFDYNISSGQGNQYTGYMFIIRSTAVLTESTVAWRVHCLIR